MIELTTTQCAAVIFLSFMAGAAMGALFMAALARKGDRE